MTTNEIAEKIYKGIGRQPFADWYDELGTFHAHLTGDKIAMYKMGKFIGHGTPSKEKIMADIKRLFNLE